MNRFASGIPERPQPRPQDTEHGYGYLVFMYPVGCTVRVHSSDGTRLYEGIIISSKTYQEDATPKDAERRPGYPLVSITTFYTIMIIDEEGNDAGRPSQEVEDRYVQEV